MNISQWKKMCERWTVYKMLGGQFIGYDHYYVRCIHLFNEYKLKFGVCWLLPPKCNLFLDVNRIIQRLLLFIGCRWFIHLSILPCFNIPILLWTLRTFIRWNKQNDIRGFLIINWVIVRWNFNHWSLLVLLNVFHDKMATSIRIPAKK